MISLKKEVQRILLCKSLHLTYFTHIMHQMKRKRQSCVRKSNELDSGGIQISAGRKTKLFIKTSKVIYRNE